MVQLSERAGVVVRRRPEQAPRAPVIGVVVAGVAAIVLARWWTGTGYTALLFGLPDPGQLTSFGLPSAQFVHELAGIAVVGLLFVAAIGLGADESAGRARRHLAELVARWAWVWVGSTAAWIVFTVSDLTGVPILRLPADTDLVLIVLHSDRVLAQIVTLWVALVLALFGERLVGRLQVGAGLLLAIGALLPSALTGHAGHHDSPVLAATVLGVHIVAASVWVGGLLALVIHLRSFPDQLRAALPRFSVAALMCVVVIGATGVVVSAISLDGWAQLWGSNRGQLMLLKVGGLVLLTGIGHLHRAHTVGEAASRRLLPLLRLAAFELALMGATIGIAVTLSGTA